MYHPDSTQSAIKRARSSWRPLVALLLFVVVVCAAYFGAKSAIAEQSARSMRSAILNTALQCYAIEGAFPASLDYLEDHYGLVINDKDYLITYECYADNVSPSVVVVPR